MSDCKYVDLKALEPKVQGQLRSKQIYISKNKKTGLSINSRIDPVMVKSDGLLFKIPGTCQPTNWCMKKCYARHGHFAKVGETNQENGVQQTRYLVNNLLFNHYNNASQTEVDMEACHIVGRSIAEGYNNIRWNGGGDFSVGAVRIINSIIWNYPDFRVWAFTRKWDMAQRLDRRDNLFVTVSMDPSTDGPDACNLCEITTRYRGRIAYAADDPSDPNLRGGELADRIRYAEASTMRHVALDVVFGYHVGSKHTQLDHPLECPSTAQVEGASCQTCRWCFMTDEERKNEKVNSAIDAFYRHIV